MSERTQGISNAGPFCAVLPMGPGQPLGSYAAARAMSFVHQDLGLAGWMTVAENIALGTG